MSECRNCITQKFSGNLIISGYCTAKEKWDLLSGVCLERRPLITQNPNELEKQMQTLLHELEKEMSYKSDHEIRHELDKYVKTVLTE